MKPKLKIALSCISALPLAVVFSTTTPAVADSQFDHLRAFYTIDQHLPQTVVIKAEMEQETVRRVEFSFTAYDNEVVPARLEVPLSSDNPPVIILLHGITQSRHQWWRTDNGPYSFPSRHRAALIDAGYAVLAIDARKHGDRITSTDFEDPSVYLLSGYLDAARKFAAETAIDVRSAINALEQIEGINANKIGIAGFSLGAIVGYPSQRQLAKSV